MLDMAICWLGSSLLGFRATPISHSVTSSIQLITEPSPDFRGNIVLRVFRAFKNRSYTGAARKPV
jgi:hypothetical protein